MIRPILLALSLAAALGCGAEAQPAKQSLTDQDKKQVQELNDQRTSEWGSSKPKKK